MIGALAYFFCQDDLLLPYIQYTVTEYGSRPRVQYVVTSLCMRVLHLCVIDDFLLVVKCFYSSCVFSVLAYVEG